MESPEIKSAALDVLRNHGWLPANGAAFAQKDFQTAAGGRTALAYLSRGDEFNFSLMGDYQSERRNVLESHVVLLPKPVNVDSVIQLTEKFANAAENAIQNSYAMRLMRPRGG
jgi:hypothetical protein